MITLVYNIEYDSDGLNVDLPKTIEIAIPKSYTDQEEIEDYISDEISNHTGFCHKGFEYVELGNVLEMKLNKDLFLHEVKKLEHNRFRAKHEIESLLYRSLGFEVGLTEKAFEENYDFCFMSKCEAYNKSLCILEINYIIDNENKIYVTDTHCDFNV